MAGARQSTGQEAMVSILRKLETMLDATNQTYEQTYLILSSTESIMKNEVSVELKKQTGILLSIEAKIGKSIEDTQRTKGKEFNDREIATMSKSLGELAKASKKINEKLGDQVKSFLMRLAEGFKSFTESVDKDTMKSFSDMISKISRGVILYALSMAIATPLLILAMPGVALFGLSIRLLMATTGMVDKDSVNGISAVLNLSKGILLFGLAMVSYVIIAPVALIGAFLFGLTVKLLLAVINTADQKKVDAMNSVLNLAKGILLFALSMAITSLLFPIVLIGAAMFALSMLIISFGINLIGTNQAKKGVANLIFLSLGIILFGLTIIAFTSSVKPIEAIFVALTIATYGLIFYVIGQGFSDILKGALSVVAISIAITTLGLSLLLYSQVNITMEQIAQLGVVIIGLGLAMFVAGQFAANIIIGSAAMIVASAAIVVLSVGLLIFTQAEFTWEDAAILGAVIVGLGITMGIAGAASPFILAGAAAMLVAGSALIPIALSLMMFKAIQFTKEDGSNLSAALGSVISGFLGGEMPGGILDSIKFAAQAAARSALLLIAVPPMILAGMALMLIVPALSIFKKAGFTKSDADNIEYMIGSVVKAFGIVTDTERQKKMGFNVDPADLFLGIQSLSGAGRVLAGLADGVKAWANLEVNEWEVINPGTKDAKLVIKGRRKLTRTDFDNAAYGIAQVLNSIAEPFAKVGKLEKGGSSGDPIYDAIFGGGFVSAGIDSLARSGDTLYNLAKGIQSWANLEVIEYEVINAGTNKAKIVPKSIRKINKTDFKSASLNIGTIVGFLANEFANVGKMEEESSGFFSDGYVKKGIEAISNLGQNITSIADAILKMANAEITEYQVDKKGNLVPVSTRKMNEGDFNKASINIGKILTIMVNKMSEVGVMVESNEDAIEAATEALPNMSKVLAEAAKPIEAWSVLKDTNKIGASMVNFYDTIKSVFDPKKNATIADTDRYFTSFTANIEKIAAPENTLDKVATNVNRIEKSMKLLKETINSLDLKKLTLTDSLMKSLAMLSKNPEAIAKAIEGSIEKSFEELIAALKELVNQSQGEFTTPASSAIPAPIAIPTVNAKAPQFIQSPTPQPDITAALTKALSAVTMKVTVENKTPIKTTT
jgi:hypothetical protein